MSLFDVWADGKNELPINCGDSFYSYLLKVTAQGGGHCCDNEFLTQLSRQWPFMQY